MLAALLLFPAAVFAQQHSQIPNPEHGHALAPGEPCATDAVNAHLLKANPAWHADQAALETYIQEQLAHYRSPTATHKSAKTAGADGFNNSRYVIPTVVHVVWGSPNLTTAGNDSISVEQIQTQFDVFFEDFRNIPGARSYDDNGVDMGLEFALASKDPNGNPTSGVEYIYDPDLAVHSSNFDGSALKLPLRWDITKYMNIYIVAEINGGNGGGTGGTILGYATFPFVGNQQDGLVMRSDCMGRLSPSEGGTSTGPSGSSRYGGTGTHEAGHWINLYHPFQSGCGSGCASSGDRICDTPPTIEANYGTPGQRQNTCSNDGNADYLDNPRNFMDYVSDAHKTHFTHEQYLRAKTALENPQISNRYNLWQDNNLQATGTGYYGPCQAGFSVKENGYATPEEEWRAFTTPGGSVKFYNYSRGQPDQFEWTFEGGTPATSTDPFPVISYDTPGSYDVQLIVQNDATTDTLEMTDYVTVLDNNVALPFNADFEESGNNLPDNFLLENRDIANGATNKTWEKVSVGGGFGNSSKTLRMSNAFYSSQYQYDGLILPPLDISTEEHASLNFSTSYAPLYISQDGSDIVSPLVQRDSLKVMVSGDGGATWDILWNKGGRQLSYGPDFLTENNQLFIPQADQWRSDTISLDDYIGKTHVLVKFLSFNDWGNNLFLDDIKVEGFEYEDPNATAREDAFISQLGFDIAPNPAQTTANALLDLPANSSIELSLYSMDGRKVWQGNPAQLPAGLHRLPIPIDHLSNGCTRYAPTSMGMY